MFFQQTAANYMKFLVSEIKKMKQKHPALELHLVPNSTQYRRDSPHIKRHSASIKKIGIVSKEVTAVTISTKNTPSDPVIDERNISVVTKPVTDTSSNWGPCHRQQNSWDSTLQIDKNPWKIKYREQATTKTDNTNCNSGIITKLQRELELKSKQLQT